MVFIQRTPIYEGFTTYRLMYFTPSLSIAGQIDWYVRGVE
jgi:hypothetical protein